MRVVFSRLGNDEIPGLSSRRVRMGLWDHNSSSRAVVGYLYMGTTPALRQVSEVREFSTDISEKANSAGIRIDPNNFRQGDWLLNVSWRQNLQWGLQ